jgi:hypothetical protein
MCMFIFVKYAITVLSETFVGLYFHEFREWLRICKILSANFP